VLSRSHELFDLLPLIRTELKFLGCHVFLEMRERRCPRNRQHDRQTTDLVETLRAQNIAFDELIFPDELHDLLRWSDWIRAYRTTAEFFARRLAASGERQ
jgi:hypothetical protein